MYSTPVEISSSFLRFAVEASLDTKKDQVDPNKVSTAYWHCLSFIHNYLDQLIYIYGQGLKDPCFLELFLESQYHIEKLILWGRNWVH